MKSHHYLAILIILFSLQTIAQDTIASQILSEVNQARSKAPLVFNSNLQRTAQQHSDDMASVDQLSHSGTDGSQFWERIQANGYVLTTGAENILSRADTNPTDVFNQWFDSDAHRSNMLNTAYTEVGIAYARASSGRFYFTMILASRADYVAPTATPLPTNTPLPPTATLTPLPTNLPTNTLIPATVIPTSTPISITATPFTLATNTPRPTATDYIEPDIRLTYDDNSLLLQNISGRVLNLSGLTFESENGVYSALRWNTEFLSQSLSGFTNGDCLQVWTFNVDFLNSPSECRYRHGWVAVGDDATFWKATDVFTVRNGEDLIGICRVADALCDISLSAQIDEIALIDPVQFGQVPDIRLEYPDSSFSLINISGRSLDLSSLTFNSESGSLSIEAWNNSFLSQPLTQFEARGCLQAWTPDYPSQNPPSRCEIRHAWILVNDTEDFWRQMDNFTVERNGTLIGRCFSDTTVCNLSLSADFGSAPSNPTQLPSTNSSPIIENPVSNSDFQLVITNESITLLNTSQTSLDVSSLAFQSSNGTFSASRWNVPELSVPLSALPSGDCLQVWGVGTVEQSKPNICTVRHGWVAAFAYEQFWQGSNTFDVYYSGQRIATCETRADTCNFDLP